MVISVESYAMTRYAGAIQDLRCPALHEERCLHADIIQNIQQDVETLVSG